MSKIASANIFYGVTFSKEQLKAANGYNWLAEFGPGSSLMILSLWRGHYALCVRKSFRFLESVTVLPLGETLLSDRFDKEVCDMKEDYRKVFGEECTPSWHLAALP
jgi:hypothetical protein